ncbi:organic cation transporter protein-like isoform X2 [Littorina saxatilis]
MSGATFDDVIKQLGEFGPYQKRVYFLLCLPSITLCMQTLLTVFTMVAPDHRCAIPGLENDTYHVQDSRHAAVINSFIPEGDSCNVIVTSNVDDVTSDFVDYNRTKHLAESLSFRNTENIGHLAENGTEYAVNGSVIVTMCSRFVYDRTELKKTVVTDMDLVCERDNRRAIAQSALMGGNLAGAFFCLAPSDYVGRHKAMMAGLLLHMMTSLGTTWSTYFPVFCCFMFIQGMAITASFTNIYTIGMEQVGPSKRVWAGFVIMIFWAIGVILLAPMAYLLRDWQHLQIATAIPTFAFLSYFWLIPESARWLVSKGRVVEAEVILLKAARVNKVSLTPGLLDSITVPVDKGQSVLTMFQHPVLVWRCAVLFYTWFVSSVVFYGLGLNVGSLGGSVYVNFLLSGVMELVSYVMCLCLLDRVGRRLLNSSLMLLAGLSCTLTIVTILYAPSSMQWTTTALAMIGKLGIAGGFATVWVYTSELFPTLVRNSGMGASSVCARIGGVVCPYVANLSTTIGGDTGTAVPLLIFGVSSILAGLFLLTLPETLNRRLPDTVTDAVNFTRRPADDKKGDGHPELETLSS